MAFATTPDFGNKPRAMRRDPRHDRALEFRRARRHSALVRMLKVVLPLIACVILSLYALPSMLTASIDKGRGTASVKGVTVEAGQLKMLDPRVKGVNEKGDAYDIVADSATQASKNADVMYLVNIRGKMTGHDGKRMTLKAPDGVHDNKADEMTFDNGATVTRDGGMSAVFRTATAFMKQSTLVSKTPVTVRLHESTINADKMTLYWNEQRAIFEGQVRTHIERQAETGVAKPEE